MTTDDYLKFDNIPIVCPNNDMLVERMSFEIKQGMHLMIAGPNGCGKSALFRVLGQLWPVTDGELHKPRDETIAYIPQRPYLPNGSLRSQLIYPQTEDHYRANGGSDEDLV